MSLAFAPIIGALMAPGPGGYLVWQWIVAIIGAIGIGVSKTGVPGLGILAVALFAIAFPGKTSPGIVLPLLICGDVIAVTMYRRHAVWSHLWRIFPWAGAGVVIGYLAMGHIDNRQMPRLIGTILVVLTALQAWRRHSSRGSTDDNLPGGKWFAPIMGILAGFTTMVANAAGPIMVLYLLAIGLPKMEFVGTGAWFFFTLNVFKVPFSIGSGMMTHATIVVDLELALFTFIGAFLGPLLLKRLNQSLFELIALFLTLVAGINLLVKR